MKHYGQFKDDEIDRLFFIKPSEFNKNTEKERLKYALGATMYIPAIKDGTLEMLLQSKYPALTSIVLCLEDSISPEQSGEAMRNLGALFSGLFVAVLNDNTIVDRLPLIFIRIRERGQLETLLANPCVRQLACGFVLPKYEPRSGKACIELIASANRQYGSTLYALPLIESARVINRSTRIGELDDIKASIYSYRRLILNIRVGGTDFSGLYGLRRGVDFSIYNLRVVADCLSDIINAFCLGDDDTVVSGPVWEYFSTIEETREIAEFIKAGNTEQLAFRDTAAVDGLIKETQFDLLNGFIGKTVIHPSQISIVNAHLAVNFEEYSDAKMIAGEQGGGALKSESRNKMNEASPHKKWAERILKRAAVYGVLKQNERTSSLF